MKTDAQRLSCAMFWHGDVSATNPLNPRGEDEESVGQLLVKRFQRQYSLPKVFAEHVGLD